MGQKVHPIGMRIKINRTWRSKWFANKKNFAKMLHQELAIRKFLNKELFDNAVSHIEISQDHNVVNVVIHTAKPGIVIGQQGAKIEVLKEKLAKEFGLTFSVDVVEVTNPATNAQIIADTTARQLERRIAYRRAAKAAIEKAMEQGAKGVKIQVAGRLNGVEISRSEYYSEGKIPLHTLRADIDYATAEANTTFGIIGIKVWVYNGEVFNK